MDNSFYTEENHEYNIMDLVNLGIVVLINSLITIPSIFLQITTILVFAWMYFVLSKSLRSAFLFEDRVASITTITFLLVLTLFSDPIRIFV